MLCTIGIDHSGWSSLNGRPVVPINYRRHDVSLHVP